MHQAWVSSSRDFLFLKNLESLPDYGFLFGGRTPLFKREISEGELGLGDGILSPLGIRIASACSYIFRAPEKSVCSSSRLPNPNMA